MYGAAGELNEKLATQESQTEGVEFAPRQSKLGLLLRVAAGVSVAACLAVVALEPRHSRTSVPDGKPSSLYSSSWKSKDDVYECLQNDEALIYKYTMASSKPDEDAAFVAHYFGATNWNISYECGRSGKTTSMQSPTPRLHSLNFALHFVWNDGTPAGERGIDDWDEYFKELNDASFENNEYNAFMDYSLTFYAPKGDMFVGKLITSEAKYLARVHTSDLDGELWYSFVLASPGQKIFEVMTTEISTEWKEKVEFTAWETCSSAHMSSLYTKHDLDLWYKQAHGAKLSEYNDGHPVMMPIRANVAVSDDVQTVVDWYAENVPAIGNTFTLDSGSGCDFATALIKQSQFESFQFEWRFIKAHDHVYKFTKKQDSVADFISYISDVNDQYTEPNAGWSAWWDRHLGIQFQNCALDDYMTTFDVNGISFHPHARANSGDANHDDQPTDHIWTGGTAGFGMEMLGSLDYTYAECYYAFEWCSWDTNPEDNMKPQRTICHGQRYLDYVSNVDDDAEKDTLYPFVYPNPEKMH